MYTPPAPSANTSLSGLSRRGRVRTSIPRARRHASSTAPSSSSDVDADDAPSTPGASSLGSRRCVCRSACPCAPLPLPCPCACACPPMSAAPSSPAPEPGTNPRRARPASALYRALSSRGCSPANVRWSDASARGGVEAAAAAGETNGDVAEVDGAWNGDVASCVGDPVALSDARRCGVPPACALYACTSEPTPFPITCTLSGRRRRTGGGTAGGAPDARAAEG